MLHKKQKITFSQARFVYQDRMGSHPGEDQSSQPKENLDAKYMSKFNREALYETAEETVTKARAILDTIQKEGKGNDGLQKNSKKKLTA
jgi:hypothetical protein